MPDTVAATHHNWIYRHGVLPILAMLRMGATPRSLAWSIAVGVLLGINPVLGTTTLLCLAIAVSFRLNILASQIAMQAMFPVELMLMVPFLRMGARVFHTAAMPLAPGILVKEARHAPYALIRSLWMWEWHAFVLWAAIAVLAVPLVALVLTPLLERIQARIRRHQPL